MDGNSRAVESAQSGPHRLLDRVVQRHRDHPWRAPLHAASCAGFERWLAHRESGRPLVVDLGCGTGESTLALAEAHDHAQVLGVDQSAARLAGLAPGGFMVQDRRALLRAEGATILRLLAAAQLRIERLYLLYPNPWPKPEHLMRRWQGHPVFPTLIELAQCIVLRTNWRIYAEEFAQAACQFDRHGRVEALASEDPPLTPFERKYRRSGHACWELCVGSAARA